MANKDYDDPNDRENFIGGKPNPPGPRVMDTMSDRAVGKEMREAMERGEWDEAKAKLEAPVKANKPDLSNVRVVDPATMTAGKGIVEEAEAARAKLDAAHPVRRLPEHMQEKVKEVLQAIAPEWTEDNRLEGLTKDEAHTVLTAAVDMLGTDHAPEFVQEAGQARDNGGSGAEQEASLTPEEKRDASRAARVAEIEAEHAAKAQVHANTQDGGRTI